jgi:hypothetical protein
MKMFEMSIEEFEALPYPERQQGCARMIDAVLARIEGQGRDPSTGEDEFLRDAISAYADANFALTVESAARAWRSDGRPKLPGLVEPDRSVPLREAWKNAMAVRQQLG